MSQPTFFEENSREFINLEEAAHWATHYLNRQVTIANISYLLQYGRIRKYGRNGNPLVKTEELKAYYDTSHKEIQWKEKLGNDLNWHLSFIQYKESERTKHVHRLHPYKGKFIPQLVEYFLDAHTDEFKQAIYFKQGDIILDPFCGSGTTLVQANELGIHAIGIDISAFNTLISNTKIRNHSLIEISEAIRYITKNLDDFHKIKRYTAFETHLLAELAQFNAQYFPTPDYRRKINKGEINEKEYAKDKEQVFLNIYDKLVKEYGIQIKQPQNDSFLGRWFLLPVREEIDFIFNEIKQVEDKAIKKVLAIILSRAVRSCRATTHADLGTLKEPVTTTYYCKKHGKICKPVFTLKGWWQRYATDTLNRFKAFNKLKTETFQCCLTGDSRTIAIYEEINNRNPSFAELISKQKVQGIFSSPPYMGLIDYHEQHAYAYEIFGFKREDASEIGPLAKGQSKEARTLYVKDIAMVLRNCKKYLAEDYHVFLVANDKFNLYPDIARLAEMQIVKQFKRPVLNRVEKDRSNAYMEIIFHLKEK